MTDKLHEKSYEEIINQNKPCIDDISKMYQVEINDSEINEATIKLLYFFEMTKYLEKNKEWLIHTNDQLIISIKNVDEQLEQLDKEYKEFLESVIPDEGYSCHDHDYEEEVE